MAEGQAPRRSPRRIKKGLYVLLGLALGLCVLVYSPLFTLQRIEVSGASYLTEQDIWAITNAQKGVPLFSLKTDALRMRLLEDLRIEDANVRRSLPGTLAVEIKERRPVATVKTDYGYADVDHTGKILAVHKSLAQMQLPLLTGFSLGEQYVGDSVTDEAALSLLTFLYQVGPTAQGRLSEISMLRPDYVVAYTKDAVQIRLGALDRMEEKAKLTAGFLQDLQTNAHPIEYVDFTYKSPFVELKE